MACAHPAHRLFLSQPNKVSDSETGKFTRPRERFTLQIRNPLLAVARAGFSTPRARCATASARTAPLLSL